MAKQEKASIDPLKSIKHVLVVMFENRSFDNLLGWLYDEEPPPRCKDFDGLHRGLWNPLNNVDANGLPFVEKVYVRKNGEGLPYGRHPNKPVPVDYRVPSPDPGEGYRATNYQLFGQFDVATQYPPPPTNMGFVNNYRDANLYGTFSFGEAPGDPRDIMICYTPEQVPVLSKLARQFAVCDRWYASVPSQTLPNRHFVHTGTSKGAVNNTGPCDARTIFQVIQDAAKQRVGLRWNVYAGTEWNRKKKVEQYFSLTRTLLTQLQTKKYNSGFTTHEQFFKDAEEGTLPSYGFIEPQIHSPGANDQKPPQDIRPAEKFLADLYNAVVNSPQWNETLLVIIYDEHGGCYDHIPPPGHAQPPDAASKPFLPGEDGFLFNRFGVRIPAVLVSPWIKKGTVFRAPNDGPPVDHTSVLATLRNCFGLTESLSEREKRAPDLGGALNGTRPRKDKPKVTPLTFEPETDPVVNDLHRLAADVMEQCTGRTRRDDEDIFEFFFNAYEEKFGKHQKVTKRQ
ncbi:MAG: phosphoesterase [bacterium]|nr:phosphoesterase [bacterium]